MILADKIINERKRNAWSQEELADKLGGVETKDGLHMMKNGRV